MKKFATKLVVMLLVVAMCVASFAACGDKKGSGTFFIGSSGPLTGDAATYGISVRNGALIAIDEINKASGINGIQIHFQMEDDQATSEKANIAVNRLMDAGMQFFMGAVTSGASIEAGEITRENNIFQITPSGSAVKCAQYDNQFRVCFADPFQGELSANFVKEKFSTVKNVGVLYNSSDEYSTGIYKVFEQKASGYKLTVQSFTEETKTDFSSQIQAFKSAGCEFVFLPFYAQEAVAFLTQAGQKGLNATYLGCDGLDGILALASDKKYVENVIYMTPFLAAAEDAETKKFVQEYKKRYNATPDQFAANAYDTVYTIKAAIEKAGIKDASMSPSDICDAMKTAMTQITVDGLTGSTTWTAQGEPNKDAVFVVIKNGEVEVFA